MSNSVSEWLVGLQSGEDTAVNKLWERYANDLVNLARANLANVPKVVADEEDVAQSVFRSICRGAAAGRFADVKSRDELWWLLLAITKQKAVNHIRREGAEKRGPGRVRSESQILAAGGNGSFNLDDLAGPSPTPEFVVALDEQCHRLLELLDDDRLRQIAVFRVEGYTVVEIAGMLKVSTRAVERKLQLIRTAWAKELSALDEWS
jgi:DNA-directed RNA polymerase specialized sigma24 family protein